MPYGKVPKGHSEFGGGEGLIDPQRRKDRVLSEGANPPGEELWEIYATNSMDPNSNPENSDLTFKTPGSGQ